MSWREIKLRAMHATPVKLAERRPEAVAKLGAVAQGTASAQLPNRATGRSRSAVRAEG
jgi:hypothetical protein